MLDKIEMSLDEIIKQTKQTKGARQGDGQGGRRPNNGANRRGGAGGNRPNPRNSNNKGPGIRRGGPQTGRIQKRRVTGGNGPKFSRVSCGAAGRQGLDLCLLPLLTKRMRIRKIQ